MDWQLKPYKGFNRISNNVHAQDTQTDTNNRPDSGVGESVNDYFNFFSCLNDDKIFKK